MPLTEFDLEVAPRNYDSPTIQVGEQDLLEILRENARLRARVDELLAESTKKAENSRSRRVRAFHQKFGHPVAWSPCVPPEDRVRFRARLITEEYRELMVAFFGNGFAAATAHLQELVRRMPVRVDLPEAVDAMEDLDYVVEGTRAEFGVESEPFAAEVQRANMDKDPNGPDGKPVKPPSWSPPDIRGCLIAQGWTPPPAASPPANGDSGRYTGLSRARP